LQPKDQLAGPSFRARFYIRRGFRARCSMRGFRARPNPPATLMISFPHRALHSHRDEDASAKNENAIAKKMAIATVDSVVAQCS
jgi:hypothetical protein